MDDPHRKRPRDEAFVREEEEAAAAEAGSIGGHGSNEDVEDAERPLREAGEGEAEGFEDAEQELIEHASHGSPAPYPPDLAGRPEDARAADATYGDADEAEATEDAEPSGDDR
jgi:hypothetical protein